MWSATYISLSFWRSWQWKNEMDIKSADIQRPMNTNIDWSDRATRRHQQLCYFFLFIFPMSTCYDNRNFATALSNFNSSKCPLHFNCYTIIRQHNCILITFKCKIRIVISIFPSSISFWWRLISTRKRMQRDFLCRICSLRIQRWFAFRFVLVARHALLPDCF